MYHSISHDKQQQQHHMQQQHQQQIMMSQYQYQQQPSQQQHMQFQGYGITNSFPYAPPPSLYGVSQQQQSNDQQYHHHQQQQSSHSHPYSISIPNTIDASSSLGMLPSTLSSQSLTGNSLKSSLPASPIPLGSMNASSLDPMMSFPMQNQTPSSSMLFNNYNQPGNPLAYMNNTPSAPNSLFNQTSNLPMGFGVDDMLSSHSIPPYPYSNNSSSNSLSANGNSNGNDGMFGLGNLMVGTNIPMVSPPPIPVSIGIQDQPPKKAAKTSKKTGESLKISTSMPQQLPIPAATSSSSPSVALPPAKGKARTPKAKSTSTVSKKRPSISSDDSQSESEASYSGVNAGSNSSPGDGTNNGVDPQSLKKQRKYDREKGIRRHENELFNDLAQMCGVPSTSDKATILKALIKLVEEKKKNKMQSSGSTSSLLSGLHSSSLSQSDGNSNADVDQDQFSNSQLMFDQLFGSNQSISQINTNGDAKNGKPNVKNEGS